MRILLVSLNKLRSHRPALPVGMVTVATQLAAHGHAVRALDLMFEDDEETAVRAALRGHRPELVGISIRNVDSQNFLEPAIYTPLAVEVADWTREEAPGARLLLGGAGFSVVPEELMEFVGADYGLTGFAEQSAVALVDRLERGESPREVDGVILPEPGGGFHRRQPSFDYRRGEVVPLDPSFYDPRYFDQTYAAHQEVRTVTESVQTKKGCVLECIFCSNFLIDGTGVKLRDPVAVVDEIEAIRDRGGRGFEVVDGVFNLPLHHALAVLAEMRRRRLRLDWYAMVNPGAVTPELVELMAGTGCREIEFGTDSGNDGILRGLKKNFRQRRIREVHRWFDEAGIRITHCLFIASPGDSRASVFETFDLIDELVPAGHPHHHAFWTLGLRIARGTNLYRIAVERGLLAPDDRLLVPRYFVEPSVVEDGALLDDIERRVLANPNWYLWWGLGSVSLRQRVLEARRERRRLEERYLEVIRTRRREVALAG
jgi:radical SAM superfamily enzyme YgiQ (UPF0313 family)